jgi:hypothetical protein
MVLVALSVFPLALGAEPGWSSWGGNTLGSGGAASVELGGGVDVDGLGRAGLGVAAALADEVDLGVVVHGYAGVGWAVGGTVEARWSLVPEGVVRLALELPVTLDTYVDGPPPRLVVGGLEPGVAMSTPLGDHTELLYGARGRLFFLSGVVVGGPEIRGGFAVRWSQFGMAVVGEASELFVTDAPARPAWSGGLEAAWHWGG